jgi:predicted permease
MRLMADATRTTGVRGWLWLIRAIGVLVPRRLRADWRQEWEAELRARELLLEEWDKLNWQNRLDLLRRSLGAFRDALLLQPKRLEEEMFQDLRFGARMLRKNPGFTLVAILTLGLGVGANTAVFSLVHKVLLAYLPVVEPERLVVVARSNLADSGTTNFAYRFVRELEAERDIFDGVLCRAAGNERVTLGTETGGDPALGELVSGNFFEVLGVKPHVGRLFTPSDDVAPGAHPVVVLSYRYWQRRFGGDPSIVGKTLRLTGYPMTVIGVTPPGFDGLDAGQPTDLRVPLTMVSELRSGPPTQAQRGPRTLNIAGLNIVARLKRGVSVAQAQQVVSARLRRYLDEVEPVTEQNRRIRESERAELLPAATGFGKTRQQFQTALQALLAITTAVLLIACLTLANLLLAKSAARSHEFAVRRAVGAGPWRLMRQLLTESVLLALCGGALGLLLAYPGSTLLMKLVSGNEAKFRLDAEPNLSVLLFHLGTAVLCGILFGLAPALSARRQSLIPGLKGDGEGRLLGRRLLVSAQVALSVVVLVGAGLFVRTVYALRATDLGFRADHLLALAMSPKNAGRSDAEVLPFFRAARERVSALPGVESVTYAQVRALIGVAMRPAIVVEGFEPVRNTPLPSHNVVGPEYFRTFGIPLVAGRDFATADDATAPKVAIVSESFARFYFAGQNPLGKKIGVARPEYTIVGVVRDTKYSHIREPAPRLWYIPYEQYAYTKYLDLCVRTTAEPESMANTIRAAIASVDSSVALFEVRSQQAQIEELLLAERMLATLASCFGVTAALLAALGLYGVLAFWVAQRRREIGIRMALGAERRDILKLILERGMKLTLGGLLVGLLAALIVTRSVASLLFGVNANDPLTFALVALLLGGVALLACYLPARRATKVDPLAALRQE